MSERIVVTDVDGTICDKIIDIRIVNWAIKNGLFNKNSKEFEELIINNKKENFDQLIKNICTYFFNPPLLKKIYDEVVKKAISEVNLSENFIKIIEKIKPSKIIAFSGTPKDVVEEFLRLNLQYDFPDIYFEAKGTRLEYKTIEDKNGSKDVYITDKVIELWDGEKRKNFVRNLKSYKPNIKLIGVGNSKNDIPMLNECDISFYFGCQKDVEKYNTTKIYSINPSENISNFYFTEFIEVNSS